jgi:hypothetical protein
MVLTVTGAETARRKHKESSIKNDLRTLTEMLHSKQVHVRDRDNNRPVWKDYSHQKRQPKKKGLTTAVVDIVALGQQKWNGKLEKFMTDTAYDEELGYPITDTALDAAENPILMETEEDYIEATGESDM